MLYPSTGAALGRVGQYAERPRPHGCETMHLSKTTVAFLFLFIGLVVGFFAGIGATKAGSAFLEELASSEAPADLVQAQSYVRPGFSFKYPENWRVEADAPENDPDHHLSVESPGSCMTMLFVFDTPTEPADNVQAHIDAFVPRLISALLTRIFVESVERFYEERAEARAARSRAAR